MILTPNQDDIDRALGTFLEGVLLGGTDVIVGQVNRTPEPAGENFIVMWPINRGRLSTNVSESEDVLFTASITAAVMNVSAVQYGVLNVGASVFGIGVASGTTVQSFGTGTGGIGTYNLMIPSPAVIDDVSSEPMAAGFLDITQPTEVTIQVDVHGPASSDNVQIISTLFRDAYGVDAFHDVNANITPLFTSEPRQVPFRNSEQQLETRYIIEAHLQVNQSVLIPQQFANVAEVDVINVEATYTP